MKRLYMVALLAAIVFAGVSCEGSYMVTAQPEQPFYTRPASPGVGYVWIDGDWFYNGGHYAWHEGRWDRPKHNRNWEAGRWQSKNNGWQWRRGHWH